jgi:hypothetical protein
LTNSKVVRDQLLNNPFNFVKKNISYRVKPKNPIDRYDIVIEPTILVYDSLGYFCGTAFTEKEAIILVAKLRYKYVNVYNSI